MNILTRRRFLQSSGAGAAGLALGSLLNVPGFLRQAMAGESGVTWNGKKVLFIFLRGGNDALNTIIPTGDPAYGLGIRPTLAIPAPDDALTTGGTCPLNPQAGRAIDLGNGFAALHPSLLDMCPVYNSGELALIHRVGYPDQSRSHFDSEQYWETGVPRNDNLSEGIFYRTVVETGLHESQALPAVSIASTMPTIIKGDVPMANISDPSRFDLLGVYAAARQKHIDSIARMHGLPYPQKKNRDITYPTGETFVSSINQIEGINFDDNSSPQFIDGSGFHLFPVDSATDEKGFDDFSAFDFFRSLKYSSQILSDTDAVIAGTELSGFDTHESQGGSQGGLDGIHAELMSWLGWAMYAAKQYFSAVGLWGDMVVVTLTEFGRTTEENGSLGTDHAEGGTIFVAGGGVNGGVYQCDGNDPTIPWATGPSGAMFDIDSRDLSRSVDYRSVLGEIIRDHLGASQTQLNSIIPGYASPAEVLLDGGLSFDGTQIAGELGLIA
jgi:uncharacterized protein (DUF1501 family)